MSKKGTLNVRVLSVDTELEFSVQQKTTGQLLFDQIIKTTGLRETWYFGLQYTDTKGATAWVNLAKKLKDQDIKSESPLQFKFRIKFFPENVADEIVQEQTLRLLYLQVKGDVLAETIYCPPDKAVLLASYATQIKHGNFDPEIHTDGYLSNDNLLPRGVITEHKLSREEWEEKVSIFHAKHKGLSKEELMLEYLKVCQDLETFGITYFPVQNKKKTDVMLGVDSLGINIYAKNNKLNPEINFPWSEIKNISYKGKTFVMKPTDKKAENFVVSCKLPKQNKRIYDLASGNHEMYLQRRRPDTLEVQQMKSQKKELMEAKAKERAELNKEMAARAKAEKMRVDLEKKYTDMEERMKQREQELESANDKIKRLEEQLEELRLAKANLESQQDELKEMMKRLEEAKNLEAEEKERKELEIKLKQEEIERVRKQVEEREEESRKLQEEVQEARERMTKNEEELRRELEISRQSAYNGHRKTSVSSASSNSSKREADEDEEGESNEPQDIPEIIIDPVEEREIAMKEEMQRSLAELENSLAEKRGQETELGKQHRENVRAGRDKYKTLREVRKGNTKRRIDSFENL